MLHAVNRRNLGGRQCAEEAGPHCVSLLLEMLKFLHQFKAKPFSELILASRAPVKESCMIIPNEGSPESYFVGNEKGYQLATLS